MDASNTTLTACADLTAGQLIVDATDVQEQQIRIT